MSKKRAQLQYESAADPAPGVVPKWRAMWLLIAACFVVAMVIPIVYAGQSGAALLYHLLANGSIVVLWMGAAIGLGWYFAERLPGGRLARLVTAGAMGLGVMSLVILGLGLAGMLNKITAWGLVDAGMLLSIVWVIRWHKRNRGLDLASVARRRFGWSALWLIAMPFLGMAIVDSIMPPGLLWQDEPAGYDITEYHLQVPREWHEAGRITGLKHNVFSYMPMNVEMHDLLAMHLMGGPYEGMYTAQLMHVGWMVLAVLGTAAMAGTIFPRPWARHLAGVLMASTPWITCLAPIAYNECGVLLFGTLAIGWAIIANCGDVGGRGSGLRPGDGGGGSTSPARAGAWWTWGVAGAMGGFACGTKLPGVVMIAGALGITLMMLWVIDRAKKNPVPFFGGMMVFGAATLIVFSPWAVRNAVWTGNPVFPEAMELLGKGHFDDVQVTRYRLAHSAKPKQQSLTGRLEAARDQIGLDWRYGYVMAPLALLGMVMGRGRAVGILGAMLILQLIVWMGFTHLAGRFFVMMIPIAAMLAAGVRWRWWPGACCIVIAHLATINLVIQHERHGWVRKVGGAGLLGMERLDDLAGQWAGFDPAKIGPGRTVWLVGDGQVLWHSYAPMARLRYRTVFDVPAPRAGEEWMGPWIRGFGDASDERTRIVILPGELERFSRTYYRVPAPVKKSPLRDGTDR